MIIKPKLKIIGQDGNAFFILAKAQKVAKDYGLDWELIWKKATAGDYQNLLRVMDEFFEVI